MKKLVAFIFFAVLVNFTYAQDAAKYAVFGSAEQVNKSKETGIYEFTFPAHITAEKVSRTASYYTDIFQVDYNPSTRLAKVSMKENDGKSRYIILRFLLANEIYDVNFDGKVMPSYEFAEQNLK